MNRAWTYIISRVLNDSELEQINVAGKHFVKTWTAHEQQLVADFSIFNKRIIIVRVNEDVTNASGCSIDKLTRFIKEIEVNFQVELLNRMLVAYQTGEAIEVVHVSKIKNLITEQLISENTIIYNTAVANDNELQEWEQPLKTTWLNKYLATQL